MESLKKNGTEVSEGGCREIGEGEGVKRGRRKREGEGKLFISSASPQMETVTYKGHRYR